MDSNGSIYIKGGNITVAGPTNAGNGALDYDGECVVTGGNLIVYGAYGMWQNPSNNSTQYSLTFQTSGKAGDKIILKNDSGTEIAVFEAEKTYGVITISNPSINQGDTYTLYVNGTSVGSLKANSIVTSNSSLNNGGMGGPNNGGMEQPNGGMQKKFN